MLRRNLKTWVVRGAPSNEHYNLESCRPSFLGSMPRDRFTLKPPTLEIFVMKTALAWLSFFILFPCLNLDQCRGQDTEKPSAKIIRELDNYWAEVSRSVREGDFDGYVATCHPSGVLVSGSRKTSYPLKQALAGWKEGFEQTQAKEMKASVEFRFSQRLTGETTSHETGMFRYATEKDGKADVQYVHFEGLLQKSESGWQIMMEYQKSLGTEAEWNALKKATTAEK